MDRRDTDLAREAEALAEKPALLATEIVTLEAAHGTARAEAETMIAAEREAEAALRATEATARAASETLADPRFEDVFDASAVSVLR